MTLKPELQLQKFCSLSDLKKGETATVMGLAESDESKPEFLRKRLQELGFDKGEELTVVAESFPGRDPIAVRIAGTIFALRKHEASMVFVHQVSPA